VTMLMVTGLAARPLVIINVYYTSVAFQHVLH